MYITNMRESVLHDIDRLDGRVGVWQANYARKHLGADDDEDDYNHFERITAIMAASTFLQGGEEGQLLPSKERRGKQSTDEWVNSCTNKGNTKLH